MSVYKQYKGSKSYLAEFDERHGGIAVLLNGNCIYPDGAYRCGEAYIDGPDDPIEKLEAAVRFYKIALDNATDEFDYYKKNTAEHNYHDDEVVETLKQMQKEVLSTRQKLRKAEGELLRVSVGAATVEEARRIKAEEDEQAAESAFEQASKEAEALGRVKSIRI